MPQNSPPVAARPLVHPFASRIALLVLAGAIVWSLCGTLGCATRQSSPVMGPDSTLVYPSKIPNDVQVSIRFTLKDSKRREEQRRLERERQRELERQRRQMERERKEREARERAERAKAKAKKKASGTPAKKKRSAQRSQGSPTSSRRATLPHPEAKAPGSDGAHASGEVPPPSSPPAERSPRVPSLPPDERVFELEEGARVQASLVIENPYGRGKRPLMFHTVWLNPEGKRVFKKMIQWTPNDSSRVLTSSLTISPSKRTAGEYRLQVYLFRELIAEKSIRLTGVSTATREKEVSSGM